ncbi:MAG: type II toxin-antitoxin system PemK/MazF family toxin [Bacteroidota bacterium]|jgi:mRNA interferase MazF
MKKSDVVLAALSQQDGITKQRPILILKEMPLFGDFLVCGISSQLTHFVNGFDEIIELSDKDYKLSGIVKPSIIRLGFLAVIPRKSIAGAIGKISDERYYRLIKNLTEYLSK